MHRIIGNYSPRFRTPALIAGSLTYLESDRFADRWVTLCFLPYVGIVEPKALDRQAALLGQIDTTLLVVSSGSRPLHRVWLERPIKPRTPLLYDPLLRLHRAFGVAPSRVPMRCQSFVIDRGGILRFHLFHDFTDRSMAALREVILLTQAQDAEGLAATHLKDDARTEGTESRMACSIAKETT